MHPHSVRSSGYSILHAGNFQGNFHYPRSARYLAICDHFPRQTQHSEEPQWLCHAQVHDTRLARPLHPNNHHKQSPSDHRGISLPFPLRACNHQQVSEFDLKRKLAMIFHTTSYFMSNIKVNVNVNVMFFFR